MPPFYTEFKYCPLCSAKLEFTFFENRNRQKCPCCDYVHWGEYSLGVGGVLLQNNKVLIVQRANNPGRGRWTIPGGYVEQDEKISDAVVREVREETGILSEPVSILSIRDRPQDLPNTKHDIYIIFLLRYLEGELKADFTEVSQAGFYTQEECCALDVASLSFQAINKAIEYINNEDLSPGLTRRDGIQLIGTLSELFTLL